MADLTLWWRGYGSADVNTDYQILWDQAASGTFVQLVAAQSATAPYVPAVTTLAALLADGDTELTMTDATDFSDGDRVKVEGETILLGGKSGDVFEDITRGIDGTISTGHALSTPVYLMHESYTAAGASFGARHVIRFRVVTVLAAGNLVAAEAVAVSPSLPPTNDFTIIWGILDQTWTGTIAGVVVTIAIGDTDNYNPRSSETYYTTSLSDTTDADGYWEILVPRAVARVGGDTLQLTVGNRAPFNLTAVPDVDTICHLELI